MGFSDCTFVDWDHKKEGCYALQVESGSVIVRGCEFQKDRPQVLLGPAVKRAVITGNIVRGKLRITDQSSGNVVVKDNVSDEPRSESERK